MSVVASLLQRFEDPVGTARPLWFDVSKWNGVISAEAMKNAGAHGCVARATVGELYTDPYFDANWNELDETGMYKASYGVYVPGQDWGRQLDHWFWVAPERDVIPRVIDLEVRDDMVKPWEIAGDVWRMVEQIKSREGVRPIIYTRAGLVEEWLEPYWSAEQINGVWWWLAQYTWNHVVEHAGPPDLPDELLRGRVVMHQTADKKPGPPGAVVSKALDYDRWELGNADEMRLFIEQEWGGAEPEEPEEEEGALVFEVMTDRLNVRSGPGVNYEVIEHLVKGDQVRVMDVGGTDAWIKTDIVVNDQAGWIKTGGIFSQLVEE